MRQNFAERLNNINPFPKGKINYDFALIKTQVDFSFKDSNDVQKIAF